MMKHQAAGLTEPAMNRICRGCGCTDDRACPDGCSWVLLDFGVVSNEIVQAPSGICSTCGHECDWEMGWMANMLCAEAAAALGIDAAFP